VNYLATFVNSKIGQIRDDMQLEINKTEYWLNEILLQPKCVSKNERCEVCSSREVQYNLELHHLAGRKHDYRTVTVCRRCHNMLSESQKTWDKRWLQDNQPENARMAFLLLGLHDVLVLRSRLAVNDVCYRVAVSLRQKISDLQITQEVCV